MEYFQATKKTNRFNKNQIVWIKNNYANHLDIRFKFRGSGRYVSGVIDKDNKAVGEIKSILVKDKFFNRIKNIIKI